MRCSLLLLLTAFISLFCSVKDSYALQRADSLLVVADSVTLRELTVTAIRPVRMLGDTLVYDVAAFPVPEGSRLRELLRRLPGVEVTADGGIMAQGKPVTCLLLNGRDFFAGNRAIVLDNLPSDVLLDVRVYERVQQDEEDTGLRASTEHVMDLTTEADNNRGWFADLTSAGGYRDRYSLNANASRFDDEWQNLITVSQDNLPQAFGIGESFYEKMDRTLQANDSRHRTASVVLGRKKGPWEATGSAYYNEAKITTGSESLTESFLSDGRLYSRSSSLGDERSYNITGNLHLERRDSMTTITFDPQLSWSKGNGDTDVNSSTADRALGDLGNWASKDESPFLLNHQTSHYVQRYNSWNALLNARLRRRLNRRGRTVTAAASWELNRMSLFSSSRSSIDYIREKVIDDKHQRQLRYSDSPDEDWQVRLRLAWIEPLGRQLRLKAEYGVSYRHENISQPVYADSVFAPKLSKEAVYDYVTQNARVLLQWSPSDRLFVSIGGQYNPVRSHTRYIKNTLHIDTLRTVYNWSPELNFYYRSLKDWYISAQYSGSSRQPSLLNLLPIVDDTDPLQVRVGNPGLKPSFVHRLASTFFWFEPNSQTQFKIEGQGQWEVNAFADVVDVDDQRGIRRTSVENVNGSWQVGGNWLFSSNFSLDSRWTLDVQGDLNFTRRVGLQERKANEKPISEDERATFSTREAVMRQYLSLQWQPGALSLKPYGFFSYNGIRAHQIDISPADLWLVGAGMVCRWETSCGWSAAIDASRVSRRGYVDAVDNDDEWLVDVELAYSFLRGRSAELRLQACDLLRQHNLSRTMTTAMGRVEAAYPHSVTHYILLSFTYRFSLMGK